MHGYTHNLALYVRMKSTCLQSAQSWLKMHWSASLCATWASSGSHSSFIMLEAGGWTVSPRATPARYLQKELCDGDNTFEAFTHCEDQESVEFDLETVLALRVRHMMNLLQDTDTECVEERADNNPEPELTLETCDSWSVSTLSLVATPSSSCLLINWTTESLIMIQGVSTLLSTIILCDSMLQMTAPEITKYLITWQRWSLLQCTWYWSW